MDALFIIFHLDVVRPEKALLLNKISLKTDLVQLVQIPRGHAPVCGQQANSGTTYWEMGVNGR